eukprot:CAMPEP_0180822378 /NCGR_PEP_ID=MMETSP1038_2-20121128/71331_1 /TAXON_ID=632150 /ORGANISM="Azadinium spinosum, Strain 3D9" /LENGTH=74 /DNA_ID=CAMNT_0022864621 /DNA_START=329 /DNA_END=549 /DNA_ORIENTATION=-
MESGMAKMNMHASIMPNIMLEKMPKNKSPLRSCQGPNFKGASLTRHAPISPMLGSTNSKVRSLTNLSSRQMVKA